VPGRIALAASSVLIALAAAPAAASAATIESSASIGPAAESYIVFVAGKGERNRLTITDSRKGVVFSDPGARMRRYPGDFGDCKFTRHRHRATCDVDRRIDIFVSLRDRDDSLRFKGSNAGPLGRTPRTDVKDAAELADVYYDSDGANDEHGYLSGGSGNDRILGTDLNDVLDGGPGRDLVDGGNGPDRIVDRPDSSRDKLRGGRGIDTVDGTGRAPMTTDLQAGTLVSGGHTDTLDSFEKARGGAGDDTLLGSDGADGLFGDHGGDALDGRGGGDYLGGDLEVQDASDGGDPGQDILTGGPGDDVLDGRDSGAPRSLTPTDQLMCGDGEDRIVALQDDLADPSCESTAAGVFSGDLVFQQSVAFEPPLTAVNPVARGADGAPTYSIACSGGASSQNNCAGRLQLERPPVTGTETEPEILGEADYDVAGGRSKDVTVVLNEAGKAALAQPGARASVHLLGGAGPNVGWQQVLGP
jgi:Ca2+-binding RTX toxin-like protein